MALGPSLPTPKKASAKKKAAPKKTAAKKKASKPLPLACSFCGKAVPEVAYVIQGPDVSICDDCVGLAVEMLEEKGIRVRTGSLIATYEQAAGGPAGVFDAWPGMHLYVGGAGHREESLNRRVSKLGDEDMRWEALPGAGKRLIPWWVQDLTADQAHAHVREVASRIDYPAVGTLVVQWVEHAKGFYAVSIGYAPGLFVQFPVEKEPVWAPKRLLPLPGERSGPRSVINPLG